MFLLVLLSPGLLLFRSPRYVSEKAGERPTELYPRLDTLDSADVRRWLVESSNTLVGQFTYMSR